MAQEKADGDKPIGTLKRLFVTKELDESIVCMAVSPDGQLVAAGSLDDGITVYDATNGAVRILLDGTPASPLITTPRAFVVSTGVRQTHRAVWLGGVIGGTRDRIRDMCWYIRRSDHS